jgi:hypothetical protein
MGNKLSADPMALVLGIIGIVFLLLGSCCGLLFGVSLILGSIGWVAAYKSLQNYNDNPEEYDYNSRKNVRFGKILCMISLVISAIVMLVYLIYFIYYGHMITHGFMKVSKNRSQFGIEDTIAKNQNQYKQTDSTHNDSLSFEYIN